jgi:hypothetical protein
VPRKFTSDWKPNLRLAGSRASSAKPGTAAITQLRRAYYKWRDGDRIIDAQAGQPAVTVTIEAATPAAFSKVISADTICENLGSAKPHLRLR